jgi:hypothetical protein
MEKISGIIPASARTQVADTSSAQPARPGAPLLGRPEGKNSLGDRVTLSKQMEAMKKEALGDAPAMTPDAPVYSSPESRKVKVIEELNKKFFTNPKAQVRDNDMTKSEEALKSTNDVEGLFFVEKNLKPVSEPLKPVTDNNVA